MVSYTPPPLSLTHTPGTQAPVASLSVALSVQRVALVTPFEPCHVAML
jgi:hypothetical protein